MAGPAAAVGFAAEVATIKTEANLRVEPNTSSAIIATLPAGTSVNVVCWGQGEPTYGSDAFGSMWLYTTLGGWVHSFLVTPVQVERCGFGIGQGSGFFYEDCDHARAAGAAPVLVGQPGYAPRLDRDSDGVGCEWDE
ncbi:MAG TPA: hypothetical protein DGG94_22665 [Micromonosporaceae bacterium]|nr:hypothetical protein [Micromonosporaceae bacterium]HCU52561.1 hypothetical protein [Micromonosporaceae bacterium]